MGHDPDHVGPHIHHQIEEVWAIAMGPATVHRYPADIGSPPHEKQILFEVKQTRHLGRRSEVGEQTVPHGTVAAAALYMPVDALNTTTNVDWGHEDMGIVGGAAIQAFVNEGGSGTPVTAGNFVEKLTAGSIAGAKALPVHMAANLIANTLLNPTITGGGSGKAILQTALGQKIDPRTDMLFEGMQYRRHVFTFKLIPRNQGEAESINNILNLFQFYMLPKYGGEKDAVTVDSFFIGYPYEFDITMITRPGPARIGTEAKSPHINKIDRSVLTSCNINHAAGDHVAFVGNYYPAATELILNFVEVRLQGRDTYGGRDGVMWHGSAADMFDPKNVIGTGAARIGEFTGINTGDTLGPGAMFPPDHPVHTGDK